MSGCDLCRKGAKNGRKGGRNRAKPLPKSYLFESHRRVDPGPAHRSRAASRPILGRISAQGFANREALTSAVGMAAPAPLFTRCFKNELIGHDGECRHSLHVASPAPGPSSIAFDNGDLPRRETGGPRPMMMIATLPCSPIPALTYEHTFYDCIGCADLSRATSWLCWLVPVRSRNCWAFRDHSPAGQPVRPRRPA